MSISEPLIKQLLQSKKYHHVLIAVFIPKNKTLENFNTEYTALIHILDESKLEENTSCSSPNFICYENTNLSPALTKWWKDNQADWKQMVLMYGQYIQPISLTVPVDLINYPKWDVLWLQEACAAKTHTLG